MAASNRLIPSSSWNPSRLARIEQPVGDGPPDRLSQHTANRGWRAHFDYGDVIGSATATKNFFPCFIERDGSRGGVLRRCLPGQIDKIDGIVFDIRIGVDRKNRILSQEPADCRVVVARTRVDEPGGGVELVARERDAVLDHTARLRDTESA